MKNRIALFSLLAFLYTSTPDGLLAQGLPGGGRVATSQDVEAGMQGEASEEEGYLANYNNLRVTELLRFISRISGKNFIYDEEELDFNVTIVSEEPATAESLMAALMQVLRVREFTMIEQGNNILISSNPTVKRPARVVGNEPPSKNDIKESELATQVFRLQNTAPQEIAGMVQSIVSQSAVVQVLPATKHVVVTDLAANVERVADLIRNLEQPEQNLVIGQYVAQNTLLTSLISLAEAVLTPLAAETTLELVPHQSTNSIYVVSTPYLVERSLSVLATLDMTDSATRILSVKDMPFDKNRFYMNRDPLTNEVFQLEGTEGASPYGEIPAGTEDLFPEGRPGSLPPGQRLLDPSSSAPALYDEQGNYIGIGDDIGAFGEIEGGEAPYGYNEDGTPRIPGQIGAPRTIPGGLGSGAQRRWEADLPKSALEGTQFQIYKLQHRKAPQVREALQKIGESLANSETANKELVEAIEAIEAIEDANALVITGSSQIIQRVRALLADLDVPLRQVFIEMLILEADIDHSMTLGVESGARLTNSPGMAGSIGFLGPSSALPSALTSVESAGGLIESDADMPIPDASGLLSSDGFSAGVIGRVLSGGGNTFTTMGGLLKAVQDDNRVNVVMNPKIIAEDNVPAEIFVGFNRRFRTDAISNIEGDVITTNFEYREIGTRLTVTPFLGDSDMVTLEIDQQHSEDVGGAETESEIALEIGPTTSETRTTTRVHIPNKHFLVISGMIREKRSAGRTRVPCLGGVPLAGAALQRSSKTHEKKNLMIFIRPQIVDTVDQMERVTRDQRRLFQQKTKPHSAKEDLETGLEFLNLKTPKFDDWNY